MSKENLEQFMNQIAESEELQAKIGEEIDAESLIALGAENGCEFTEEDIQESAELSDEELDRVAGGRYQTHQLDLYRLKVMSGPLRPFAKFTTNKTIKTSMDTTN